MAITPIQRMLVQRTFAQAATKADAVIEILFNRLIELDPASKPLFAGLQHSQRRKVMQTLAIIVNSLNKPDVLIPLMESLGKQHVSYGVEECHYALFGKAWLWTLEKSLGRTFTPDARESWRSVYHQLSQLAIKEAYPDGRA